MGVVHGFCGNAPFGLELPVEHFFAGSKVVLFIAAAVPFILRLCTLIDIEIDITI